MEDKFKEIRSYNDDEIQSAMNELLADRQFNMLLKGFVPWLPKSIRNGLIKMAFYGIHSTLDFQKRFMKPVVNYVFRKTTTGHTFEHPYFQPSEERYAFISNHRDIVLDSAFLDVMLFNDKFATTCEIGIGNNLLIYNWIRILVRLNKAFIVRRGLSPRELFASSQLMSQYIHHAITEKRENMWLAQREGRAKDSNDRTQEAVLKMLAMGKEGDPVESLKELNIVPLTISYEYDPCDYLKAMEFQLKRDNPTWKKSKQDDLDNMKTGILGKKGHVHYQAAAPINTWIDEYAELPKTEVFKAIAQRMDQEIHRNYRLYPGNYIAADQLAGSADYKEHYTDKDVKTFEKYLQSRLALIDIPNKDEAYLRNCILTMYANPVINKQEALKTK